jgi:hypothetical protein
VEGGGFCGIASPKLGLDLAEYDGLSLRVRGNGETFKINVKTIDQVRPDATCISGAESMICVNFRGSVGAGVRWLNAFLDFQCPLQLLSLWVPEGFP